jgi:nitrogen fixation protein FixH
VTEQNSNANSLNRKTPWYKSPWVIGWLLLVLTVMAVNAFMIMKSVNDFPGLVVDDFYERGQDYEENIHKKIQNNQKWQPKFQMDLVYLNQPVNVFFSLNDQAGKPAPVEKVTLFAYRPSNSKKDFSVAMKQSEEKEIYLVSMRFDTKGKWDLLASVIIDGTEVNYAKSIFVQD